MSGLPLIDLLNFFVVSEPIVGFSNKESGRGKGGAFSANTDKALPGVDTFKKTFYSDSWYADLVKQLVLNYCKKVKIKPMFFNILFLVFIRYHLMRDRKSFEMFLERGLPKWCR